MRLELKTALFILVLFCLSTVTANAYYFSDNFNSYTSKSQLSTNWDSGVQGFPQITLDATGGVSGSPAVKFAYNTGTGDAWYPLQKYFGGAVTGQLYSKFKFKIGSGATGGMKFFKIFGTVIPDANYANWTWNFGDGSTGNAAPPFLTILCYGNGTDTGVSNDTNTCIRSQGWYTGNTAGVPMTIAAYNGFFTPAANTWYTVETYNKYSTNGNSDGEMWIKVNGTMYLHITNCVNRSSTNSRTIDHVAFGDYAFSNTSMSLWFDDIELSDSPISSTSASTPTAPTGIKVASTTP